MKLYVASKQPLAFAPSMAYFKVSAQEEGKRADVFVAAKYLGFTRSALKRLFDIGSVSIAGRPVKASQRLSSGVTVRIEETLLRKKPRPIKLPIIYEDDSVVVINKPAGILTHSKGALNFEPTIASFIAGKLSHELEGNRAGIVHRLDRATSGLIITAKTAASQKWLQKQFSNRRVKKMYLAIVPGELQSTEALIDVPIARNPAKPQTFYSHGGGKSAQTRYKTIKIFHRDGQTYSLLELYPVTGRTHQLRVHLQYLKHPIMGDNIYGQGGDKLMLHAARLELTLPDKQHKTFKAPTPDYIKEFAGL
ncbi:MAG TPA: RluA family pseudouridine synthase [Candidatus Saccharimonadales bacterium]|nr:RluA family pseudouridine synthase [Candidatus Saccharimonadales bacterium]